jgi:hypothetical protein
VRARLRNIPFRPVFGANATPREVIGKRRLDGTPVVTCGYAGIVSKPRASLQRPVRTSSCPRARGFKPPTPTVSSR